MRLLVKFDEFGRQCEKTIEGAIKSIKGINKGPNTRATKFEGNKRPPHGHRSTATVLAVHNVRAWKCTRGGAPGRGAGRRGQRGLASAGADAVACARGGGVCAVGAVVAWRGVLAALGLQCKACPAGTESVAGVVTPKSKCSAIAGHYGAGTLCLQIP